MDRLSKAFGPTALFVASDTFGDVLPGHFFLTVEGFNPRNPLIRAIP